MPIYAFQCTTCGHDFDKLQRLSDPDPEVCPDCGARTVKRQLTAPSFRLAGSGWYETDFKKDGDRKRNLVEGKDGGATAESKSDAKSDAKPDTKTDGKSADAKAGGTKSESAKSEPAKTESKPATKPAPKSTSGDA